LHKKSCWGNSPLSSCELINNLAAWCKGVASLSACLRNIKFVVTRLECCSNKVYFTISSNFILYHPYFLFFFWFEETHPLESVLYESRWVSKIPTVPGSYKRCTAWLELKTCYADLKSFVIALLLYILPCNSIRKKYKIIFETTVFIFWCLTCPARIKPTIVHAVCTKFDLFPSSGVYSWITKEKIIMYSQHVMSLFLN